MNQLQAQMNALCVDNRRQPRLDHVRDTAAIRDPEINRSKMFYVFTTRRLGNARENATYHAIGNRETGPAVRNRGKRRRLEVPPHFRIRQKHAHFVSVRYRRRHLRLPDQQNSWTRE